MFLFINQKRLSVGFAVIFICSFILLIYMNPRHGMVLIDSHAVHKTKDNFGRLPMPLKGMDNKLGYWEPYQQKVLEQQAALNLISHSPLLGIGLGNYQKQINPFYSKDRINYSLAIEKSAFNYMEKDSHPLFMIQAVESGILAAIILMLVMVSSLKLCFKHKLKIEADKSLIAGAAAAIIVMLIASFYSSFMVRGLQFFSAFFLILPYALTVKKKKKKR